jgi:hypothetical protein
MSPSFGNPLSIPPFHDEKASLQDGEIKGFF